MTHIAKVLQALVIESIALGALLLSFVGSAVEAPVDSRAVTQRETRRPIFSTDTEGLNRRQPGNREQRVAYTRRQLEKSARTFCYVADAVFHRLVDSLSPVRDGQLVASPQDSHDPQFFDRLAASRAGP